MLKHVSLLVHLVKHCLNSGFKSGCLSSINYVYGKQLKLPRDHVYPSLASLTDALLAGNAIFPPQKKEGNIARRAERASAMPKLILHLPLAIFSSVSIKLSSFALA